MFVSNGVQYASRAEFERLRVSSKPTPLAEALSGAAVQLQEAAPTLVSRLRKRLGLGDDPKRRMALYLRLQAIYEKEPGKVEQLVSETWAQAVGARMPDRYFCKSIMGKLAEAGLMRCAEGSVQHEPI